MFKIIRIFVSTLVVIIGATDICYAAIQVIPLTIKCRPSAAEAGWKEIAGKPNVQYSLTSVGIKIDGEVGDAEGGLFTKWDDLEHGISRHGIVHVIAKCIPFGAEMDMFPDVLFSHDPLPTLVCAKGEGLAIRFLSPNDPDPNKYVYHGKVTIARDELLPYPPSKVVGAIPIPIQGAMEIPNPTEQLVSRVGLPPSVMVGGSGTGGSPTK